MILDIIEYGKIRQEIIKTINDYSINKSYISACWLGGSDANNEVDKYSDIDLFLCVDDSKVHETFLEIEKELLKIGRLDFKSAILNEENQKIKFFHIEGTPKSLYIDIGVIKKSESVVFEREHPYFKPKVLFDKDNIIQYKNVDNIELSQKILKHIKIQKDLVGQSERIQTYINRNNYIEATNYYIKFMYLPLVGILRVKYTPRLYNWGRIHISRHFSPEIVMKLEDLMKLNSIQDIEGNLEKSRRWFIELIAEIESE